MGYIIKEKAAAGFMDSFAQMIWSIEFQQNGIDANDSQATEKFIAENIDRVDERVRFFFVSCCESLNIDRVDPD